MSVTASTLSAIQQAWQSIDVARQSLVAAVNEQAQRVMLAVAEQPFSVGNDKLFASWKTLISQTTASFSTSRGTTTD